MDEIYVTRLIDGMETFMLTVRKLRPGKPWPEVAAAVTRADGTTWTVRRLRQSVRRIVVEGLVDRAVMGRSVRPRHRRTDELAILVQGIALANPDMSLRAIAGQLEAIKLLNTGRETRLVPNVSISPPEQGSAGGRAHYITRRIRQSLSITVAFSLEF
jgi:hypothetical protein